MAADGQVRIKVTVDGKEVTVATTNLNDLQKAAKGVGENSKGAVKQIKDANSETKDFGSSVKSLVTALGLMKIASAAFNVLKDNIGAAITRFDKLNAMPRVLEALGASTEDAEKSMSKLSKGIEGLPTSLDEISGTMQSMFLVFRDADKATDSALALNNALLASGTSGGAAAGAMEQYLQALQKGKPDMMEWRNMQSNMNVALDEIANNMGISINKLGQDLRSGKLSMMEFNDMIIEVAGSSGRLGDLAKTMTSGIGTSFNNLKLAVVRGLEGVIRSIDEALQKFTGKGIAATFDGLKIVINSVFSVIKTGVAIVVPVIGVLINVVKGLVSILKALSPVILAVVAGFVAWKVAVAASNVVSILQMAYTKLMSANMLALAGSTTIATAASGVLTTATTALNAAFAANPIGLIIAAVAALAVGIYALVKAMQKGNKEAQEHQKKVDELGKAEQAHSESVQNSIEAYKDQTTERNAAKRAVDSEINQLEKLMQKENKSAAEKAKIVALTDSMNESMSDLNIVYDEEADALNMSVTALKSRAASLDVVGTYNDALEQQASLTQDLAMNEELLAQNSELMAEAIANAREKGTGNTNAYLKQVKDLKKQEDSLLATQEDLVAQQAIVNNTIDKYGPAAIRMMKVMEEQKKIAEEMASSADELSSKVKKVTDNVKKNAQEYKNNARQINAETDNNKKLSQELSRLSSIRNKSADDIARIQSITELLNVANSDLNLTYDAEKDAMSLGAEERQRRIELMAEEASYSAAFERMLEIDNERYEAEVRLGEIADFREEYNQMLASGIALTDEQAASFSELFEEEEALKLQTQVLGDEYDATMSQMAESSTKLNELRTTFEGLNETQKESLESMITSMQDYQSKSQNIFSKLNEGTATSWEEIMDTMNHNAEVLNNYWINIGILMEKGVNEGLIQQIVDAGISAAPEAAALAEKASLSDADIAEINETYKQAGKMPEEVMVAQMKLAKMPVNKETKALVREIETALLNETGKVNWESIAENIPEGVMDGAFNSGSAKKARSGAAELAKDMSNRFAKTAEIRSPSKVFYRHGENLINGLVDAITSGMKLLQKGITALGGTANSAMQDVVNLVKKPFDSIGTSFSGYGKNMSSNLGSGITANKGLATSAATGLANAVSNAVKNVGSSYHAAGSNITSAIASGIQNGQANVINKATSLKNVIINAFSNMYNSGANIGYNLVAGIVTGLNNNAWRVRNAANAIANSIPAGIRKILAIRSPSKVMEKIGSQTVEGLSDGFAGEENSLLQMLSKLVDNMLWIFKDLAINIPDISAPNVTFGSVNAASGAPALAFSGATGIISSTRSASAVNDRTGASSGMSEVMITGNQFVIREEADILKVARQLEEMRWSRRR